MTSTLVRSNSWMNDDAWQKYIRDLFLLPFYQKRAYEGRFVFFEKGTCSTHIQRRLAVDTAYQLNKENTVCVEEKIVRQPWESFFLETESCTVPGHESDGWMKYGKCDTLLYAYMNTRDGVPAFLDAYALEFPSLQEWFWSLDFTQKFRSFTNNTYNRTRGYLVSIATVIQQFPDSKRFIIADKGLYKEISLQTSPATLEAWYQYLITAGDYDPYDY